MKRTIEMVSQYMHELRNVAKSCSSHYNTNSTSIEIDESTKVAVIVGAALGLILTVFLAFFPGKPTGLQYGDSFCDSTAATSTSTMFESTKINKNETENLNKKVDNDENVNTDIPSRQKKITIVKGKEKGAPRNPPPGKKIYEPKIKAIQNLLGLSEAQMKQAISDSTSSTHKNQDLSSSFSLTQIVNNVVYTILFTLLLYVLNRDSNGAVVDLFKLYFPREAKVLRLI